MNFFSPLIQILTQFRDLIASMVSSVGLSRALTLALADFSLAVIVIVPLIIWPQIAVLILVVLLILQVIKR